MSQIAIDKIYETDFYQWTMKQAQALKEQNVGSSGIVMQIINLK